MCVADHEWERLETQMLLKVALLVELLHSDEYPVSCEYFAPSSKELCGGRNHLHDALRPEVVQLPFLDSVADVGALDGELEKELRKDGVMKPTQILQM